MIKLSVILFLLDLTYYILTLFLFHYYFVIWNSRVIVKYDSGSNKFIPWYWRILFSYTQGFNFRAFYNLVIL